MCFGVFKLHATIYIVCGLINVDFVGIHIDILPGEGYVFASPISNEESNIEIQFPLEFYVYRLSVGFDSAYISILPGFMFTVYNVYRALQGVYEAGQLFEGEIPWLCFFTRLPAA